MSKMGAFMQDPLKQTSMGMGARASHAIDDGGF